MSDKSKVSDNSNELTAKEEEAQAKELEKQQKMAEIIEAYAKIAKEHNSVGMNDLIDAGYTKDTITYYFRNLQRLNLEARSKYPEHFFDISLDEIRTPKRIKSLKAAIKKHKRFIITTAVTGCQVNPDFLNAMKSYCQKMDAHILVLVASDPAHNKFAPGAKYGTIDQNLVDDPDVSIVLQDIALNSNLQISTIKLAAKQIDQTTGMLRMAANKGSFIFASPKQRMKPVPVAMGKVPYCVMTTGAITFADYVTSNYMSQRTAWIATEDHQPGGLIVEIENKKIYHFRQMQSDENGAFIDLGTQYNWDGTTETVVPTLVMGDWHSGSTDPKVVKSKMELIKALGVQQAVLHDGFDSMPVNGHEANDTVLKAQRFRDGQLSLEDALKLYAKDINQLIDKLDKLVIVKSNHDDMLDRWLRKGYYTQEPMNHRLALDLAAQLIDGNDPLKYGVERFGLTRTQKVQWLKLDEDFKIAGIQLGAHGHKGPNGSRGNISNMELCYGKSVTGHTHSPQILRGAWQVGTSTLLRLGYNEGPSSWMQTDCLVYPNGARQLINFINGSWKMK